LNIENIFTDSINDLNMVYNRW